MSTTIWCLILLASTSCTAFSQQAQVSLPMEALETHSALMQHQLALIMNITMASDKTSGYHQKDPDDAPKYPSALLEVNANAQLATTTVGPTQLPTYALLICRGVAVFIGTIFGFLLGRLINCLVLARRAMRLDNRGQGVVEAPACIDYKSSDGSYICYSFSAMDHLERQCTVKVAHHSVPNCVHEGLVQGGTALVLYEKMDIAFCHVAKDLQSFIATKVREEVQSYGPLASIIACTISYLFFQPWMDMLARVLFFVSAIVIGPLIVGVLLKYWRLCPTLLIAEEEEESFLAVFGTRRVKIEFLEQAYMPLMDSMD